MTPEERWRRVEDLFERASECAAEDRAAFLAEECAGDRALLEEVESLVEAAVDLERRPAPPAAADPWIGRSVGCFRLERLIGRGGMGPSTAASASVPLFSSI